MSERVSTIPWRAVTAVLKVLDNLLKGSVVDHDTFVEYVAEKMGIHFLWAMNWKPSGISFVMENLD